MRFGLVHRIMTDALATLGFLSLLTSGNLDKRLVIAMVLALVAALSVPERLHTHPWMRNFGTVSSLALLGTQVVRLVWGHDVLSLAVEFAAGLQLIRLATRRGAAHDQQIILLSLLHLVAGTVFGGGLAYAACFVAYLTIVPGALVLSHLRREVEGNYRQGARDRTGLPVDVPRILRSRRVVSRRFLAATCSLSIPIFLFTGLLFVLFPRVGLSLLMLNRGRSERMIGFSDRVDLGKVGRLRTDTTIAARVYLPNMPDPPPERLPLYLRGTAFDSYDGRSWRRDKAQAPAEREDDRVWVTPPGYPVGEELMTIDLEPIRPSVVFLPSKAGAFDLVTQTEKLLAKAPVVTRGRESDFYYETPEQRGLRYRVYARHPLLYERAVPDAARYLTLPAEVNDRLRQLAHQWAAGLEDPLAIAQRVEHRLRTEFAYDLNSPSGAADNPLDHFLFESQRGHCEYFSTSMAILLRVLGIPTRNVTGFIGGTLNRFGQFYAVRQGDAHSWTEVFIDGRGWQRFDPTPSAAAVPQAQTQGMFAFVRDLFEAAGERWDRHVIGYDLDQQLQILNSLRDRFQHRPGPQSRRSFPWGRVLLIVVGVGVVGFATWRWYRSRPSSKPLQLTASDRNASLSAQLYRELEDAMRYHGVARRPEVPPLTHAQALVGIGHPLAGDFVALTREYQAMRFGGLEATEARVADFRRRVKALKARELVDAA